MLDPHRLFPITLRGIAHVTVSKFAKSLPRVPVTLRALLQRINRKIRPGFEIRKASPMAQLEVGEFFRIDIKRGVVVAKYVKVEAYARELGVLKAWETLA